MESLKISSVVSCHICPIRFILEQNKKSSNEPENYTIAKQISNHLGEEILPDDIWDEIKIINPEISSEYYELYKTWVDNCRLSKWSAASQNDVKVSSKKLGIHGTADRYFDSKPHLALTRLSPAPKTGIYKADRVRCACFSLCARESPGIDANEIILEYIPSGISKICTVSPRDRRDALSAIRMAKKIMAGKIPTKHKNLPCDTCYLKDKCTKGPVKLSELI